MAKLLGGIVSSNGNSQNQDQSRNANGLSRYRLKPLRRVAFVFLGIAFGSTACAPRSVSKQWQQNAPQSAQQTGIVISTQDPAEAHIVRDRIEKLLKSNENFRAREIDANKGFYEVFNADSQTVNESLSGIKVETFHNVFMPHLVPTVKAANVDLSKCVKGPQAPSAVITPSTLQTKLANGLIDIKDGVVTLTSSGSATTKPGQTLDVMWVVDAPEGSNFAMATAQGSTFSFQPDLPGGYSVYLVTQDRDSLCGKAVLEFGVTENDPYNGPAPSRPFDAAKDPVKFQHLGEINAFNAWALSKGDGAVIAVLDTGVNYNHPDLRSNVFLNSKEIPGNGFDDDGNGYVDDVLGWDFFSNDNIPFDDGMHGTHVAGIAAGSVVGVAPLAKILAVKVLGPQGGGDLASIIGGIQYAADRGAAVINMSLGIDTTGMSQTERMNLQKYFKKAIDYARLKGTVVAAAAGNGDPFNGIGYDTDKTPNYPSAVVGTSNLVAVAAVDSIGTLTEYSNFGISTVQVAAPGGTDDKPIQSTFYAPQKAAYVGLSGTSMATPVVSGVIALMKGAKTKATPDALVAAIQSSVSKKAALAGKVKSGGEVDAKAAILAIQAQPTGVLGALGSIFGLH